jgi:hypothetical protein
MRSVSEGVNELKPLERRPQNDERLVMPMKLKYPYKTATGCSSFPLTGMEGALADADLAMTSEVVALYHNPGSGLCEQMVHEGGMVHLCPRETGSNFPRQRRVGSPRVRLVAGYVFSFKNTGSLPGKLP